MMNKEIGTAHFYDRLTGKNYSRPEVEGTLMGRWLFCSDIASDVPKNSVQKQNGEFLVPDDLGTWTVADSGERVEGTVNRQILPERLEAESLRIIGDRLRSLIEKNAAWLEWLDIVPLVPGISDDIHILPFETRLDEHYHRYLESVCNRPRAHLHLELDRLPVSRARRIPVHAANYLAAHTEDWDGRLIRGVMPKRVLAEVRRDQLDIYENRVVARLLDHLLGYLNDRILKLQKLLKMFQEKEDYSSGATGGTYQRRQRVMAIWGNAINANEGKTKALETLQKLEKSKYKLMGLLNSSLYREIPRRTYVSTTLRPTNILVNDPCYRQIAELWREWSRVGASKTKSVQQQHEEKRQICRGMDSFTMLLIVRALDQLGYEPIEEDSDLPIKPGMEFHVQCGASEVDLIWNGDGTLSVKTEKHELRVVPLCVDLKGAKNERIVRNNLEQIREAVQHISTKVLVLYAGNADMRSHLSTDVQRALQTVGNDPRSDELHVGFLPISPWEIGSTERVVRALRWFLTGTRFVEYPWKLDVSPEVVDSLRLREITWLRVAQQQTNQSVELVRPPHDYEWEQLALANTIRQARTHLQQCEQRHQQISDDVHRAARSGNGMGSLNQQKKEASQKHKRAQKALEDILNAEEKLKAICGDSKELLVCPICGSSDNPISQFQPLDKRCFSCQCLDCKSRWETRLCKAGHKYPVILPSGKYSPADAEGPGWEDRTYGGDILSLPARTPDGDWGIVCSECGDIS